MEEVDFLGVMGNGSGICTLWPVFHRTLRPVLNLVLWYFMSSVLPSLGSNAPLVTGISNPMASLRRSSFFLAHHWWRDLRNGSLVSDALIRGGFIFFEFVCLIRFIVLANDRERFCCFTNVELSLSYCCSWLKGEPPGTRTLAAGSRKKGVMGNGNKGQERWTESFGLTPGMFFLFGLKGRNRMAFGS